MYVFVLHVSREAMSIASSILAPPWDGILPRQENDAKTQKT